MSVGVRVTMRRRLLTLPRSRQLQVQQLIFPVDREEGVGEIMGEIKMEPGTGKLGSIKCSRLSREPRERRGGARARTVWCHDDTWQGTVLRFWLKVQIMKCN
jgi:hypothetical protein